MEAFVFEKPYFVQFLHSGRILIVNYPLVFAAVAMEKSQSKVRIRVVANSERFVVTVESRT